jgi:hypothetical protein
MFVCPGCGTPLNSIDVEFDYGTGIVKSGNRSCRLSEMELTIFECLLDAYPHSIMPSEILGELYADRDDDDLPTSAILPPVMHRIGKKLSAAGMPFALGRFRVDEPEMGWLLVPHSHTKIGRKAA